MKSKGTRALLVTVGGGLVVFLLLAAFLGGLRSTTEVVVAAQPLPAGARLTANVLEVRQVHSSAALPNALKSIEEAEGQVLTVARIPGDQITADMLGDQATVGIANQLEAGHRAVAVHVNQASGLVGILRPGDRVAVVAIVNPQEAGVDTGSYSPFATSIGIGETVGEIAQSQTEITSTISSSSPAAYVVVSGLRVLLVPQTFRYEETLPGDEEGAFSLARTTAQAAQQSVILLDVPVEPVEVAPGVKMSPAALLPLLDANATLHLLLEPATDDGVTVTVGANLGDLYRAIVGLPPENAATTVQSATPVAGGGGE